MFIFRLTAFLSLLGLVGYLLLGPKVPKTLTVELERSNEDYNSLKVHLESDKNKSESELSVVFRSRVDFRNKEEEAIGKIQDLKSEINGLAPKLDEFEDEIKTKSDELEKLTEEFSESRKPIDTIVHQKKPLEEKLQIIEEEKSQLVKELAEVKQETKNVEIDYNLLVQKRNQIRESFEEDKIRLMDGIKKPFHLYYSDVRDVEVANRAPSGKGIFINQGYQDGFREGMEFITKNPNAVSKLSFRLVANLVQKNFSYLEFLNDEQVKDSSFAQQGDNLQLIRSGNSLLPENTDQNNSLKN